MTENNAAPPPKKGCGPILVAMIAVFFMTMGLLAGAGGLYAFLHFTDDGVETLGLAQPVAAPPTTVTQAPAEPPAAATARATDNDDVYALAFPIQETVQIQGQVEEAAVRNRLNRDRFELQQCYLEELQRSPETRGELSLQFTVSGSTGGVIAAVSRGNYTGSDALSRCVLDKIRTWTFPPPETSQVAVVRFDMLFLPFRADGT